MPLPPLPSIKEIHNRLQVIYPEGIPNRNYCIREMSARTIFVMLYVGAIESDDVWFRPDQATSLDFRVSFWT